MLLSITICQILQARHGESANQLIKDPTAQSMAIVEYNFFVRGMTNVDGSSGIYNNL